MNKLKYVNIEEFDTYIFDLDGTIYLGGIEIPGSIDFIKRLQNAKKNVYVITNNSSKTALTYWNKLDKLGISLPIESVINSTVSLIKWLNINKLNQEDFFIFGTNEMKDQLSQSGISHKESAKYVIIGNNTEMTWGEFVKASKLIADGAKYIVSNPDFRMPLKNGYYSPDAGAMSVMMEHTTGIKPMIILGKPTKEMIEPFIKGKTILFGDRIYTDMKCAKNAGISNALVLSGEATYKEYQNSSVEIDYVMNTIGDSK
ncbi:MAG: HAD-IIA family hydrolase [Mycoplasmataceae bacterium]|nr:HAD-IIA family hydrolase [Mycoplasmataceae bacterium]